jgi:hypothetical protein
VLTVVLAGRCRESSTGSVQVRDEETKDNCELDGRTCHIELGAKGVV